MNAKEFSINDQTKNFEEFRKQYKELEIKYHKIIEENNRLKIEIKKFEEKTSNELKNLEEFRKQYKELEIKNLETFRRK